MDLMNRILSRFINWKTLLALFLLCLPLVLVAFPWRKERLVKLTHLAEPTFDVRIAYTPQELLRDLPSFGLEARRLYAVSELTLDFVFPLLYNPLLIVALALIYRRLAPAAAPMHKLAYLPFGLWLADLSENASLACLFLAYPPALTPVAWAASFFSLMKWLLGGLILILIVAGLLRLAFTRLRNSSL